MNSQTMGLRLLALAALAGVVSTTPTPGVAQAVCSAPHSSPTLAGTGSVGTLPRGGGWIQLSALGQRATRFFAPNGNRQDFLAGSEFDTRSLYLTGSVGVLQGLEIWFQAPFHRLEVESDGGNSESTGLGDLRLAARLGPQLVGRDFPLTLRLAAKVPGEEFPVDATVLPLTEGQRDWEMSLETGYFLRDESLYLTAWAGYRWREENTDADRDPGNEYFGHLAFGGWVGELNWELAANGLWGKAPVAQGFTLEGDGRRMLQLLPAVGYGLGPGRVEASAQIPLWGKNLPVGNGVSLGYRLSWGLTPDPLEDLRDFFKD